MTDDLVGRLRKLLADAEQQRREALNHLPGDTKTMMLANAVHAERHVLAQVPLLFARIEALEVENGKLREAIKPFADCADELDGSEWTPRAPDGEWAKFRLLTDDYRAARAALTPEAPHAD